MSCHLINPAAIAVDLICDLIMNPPKAEAPKLARKIVTSHVYPPIPIRSFDWCAYFDGDEEGGLRGWGTTEQQAIADLIENAE